MKGSDSVSVISSDSPCKDAMSGTLETFSRLIIWNVAYLGL